MSPIPPPPSRRRVPLCCLLFLSVSTLLPSCDAKTIIGYYASWQWYDRSKLAQPKNMDFAKVDRVNFAFFQTDVNGNVWGTDSWADPQVLFGPRDWTPPPSAEDGQKSCSWDGPMVKACNHHKTEEGLISLAHAAGATVYPSIGGWTLSDAFPAMASSQTSRTNFANKCVDLIKEYGFDGIDLDWEYPGYDEHSGTAADKQNFNKLLDAVRSALDAHSVKTGQYYGLTAALPCGPDRMADIDIPHISRALTELNLMTYDFHGAWDDKTGVNAPVYPQGWGPTDFDVDSCVQNWIKGGADKDSINIGLPFYGRSFKGATGLNQQHGGTDKNNWFSDEGTPQYFNIVKRRAAMMKVRDQTTQTTYAYFPGSVGGGLVSYDDERAICDKAGYVLDEGLNGFIIWELSGDLMQDLSTPLLDTLNAKLDDPSMECGSPSMPNFVANSYTHTTGSTQVTTATTTSASNTNPTPATAPAPTPKPPTPSPPTPAPAVPTPVNGNSQTNGNNNSASQPASRCGVDWMEAGSKCGNVCSSDADCVTGKKCWAAITCGGRRRGLRARDRHGHHA